MIVWEHRLEKSCPSHLNAKRTNRTNILIGENVQKSLICERINAAAGKKSVQREQCARKVH